MTQTDTAEELHSTRGDQLAELIRSHAHALVGALMCVAISGVLAVFYLGSAATSCSTDVRGAPGDGTNGAVWLNYVWNKEGGSPLAAQQHETGAPVGDALWEPEMVTNAAYTLPMWAIAKVAGPVCAYNITIGAGFVTSALAMYALAWHVTRSRLVGIAAGLIFAFSAFAQLKSEGHLSGVYLAGFPLLVLCLLRMWQRPGAGQVVLTSVVWAWVCYVDGYYLPFSLVLAGSFVLGALVADLTRHHRDRTADILRSIRAVVLAGAGTCILLIPWLLSIVGNRDTLVAERSRSLVEAEAYAARPLEYLVPAHTHPLFYTWSAPWRAANLHGSNAIESTIYLGLVPLALAVLWIVARPWRRDPQSSPDDPLRVDRRLATFALASVGLAGFLSSLSPAYRVFGLSLPMPSRILWEVFPALRVFSRFFVLVSMAVVGLAALALADLARRIEDTGKRILVAGTFVAAGLFESLALSPLDPPTWSFSQSPTAYSETGDDPSVELVARYPLTAPSEKSENAVLTFQLALDRPLVNPVTDPPGANDAAGVARGLASLTDPQTIPTLRALGVDTLLVERQSFGAIPPDLSGLRLYDSYSYSEDDAPNQVNGGAARWAYLSPYYDIDVYRVEPGTASSAFVTLGSGWAGIERVGWSGARWMVRDAEVFVRDVGPPDAAVLVRFNATSFAVDRQLTVTTGGAELASFDVSSTTTNTFEFTAPVGAPLVFESTPEADPVVRYDPTSVDPRSLSVMVSAWEVSVL